MNERILQAFEAFKASRLLRKPAEVDEGALRRARERGHQAKAILNDPIFVEAFELVEKVYMDGWRNSSLDEKDKRERAWTAVALLSDLRAAISTAARDGTIAEESLMKLAGR